MEIFVLKDEQQTGPYSFEALKIELTSGNLSLDDLVWHDGIEEWQPFRTLLPKPPPLPSVAPIGLERSLPVSHPKSDEDGSADFTQEAAFSWWPVSVPGQAIFSVVLLLSFFVFVGGGIAASAFLTAFLYFVLTCLRLVLFKVRRHSRPQTARRKTPLWRHPGTIGAGCTLVLVMFLAIASSQESSKQAHQLQTAIQQNSQQASEYNSNGKNVGRFLEAFGHGFIGDIDHGFEINREVDAQNREFSSNDHLLKTAYSQSLREKEESGLVILLALLALATLGLFVGFRILKAIYLRNRSNHQQGGPPPPQFPPRLEV